STARWWTWPRSRASTRTTRGSPTPDAHDPLPGIDGEGPVVGKASGLLPRAVERRAKASPPPGRSPRSPGSGLGTTQPPPPSGLTAMFAYYFQLGLRSLRRNPLLTALMVMAIGFGVAASMTTWSVFRATA